MISICLSKNEALALLDSPRKQGPRTPRIGNKMQISGHNLGNIPTAGGH